MYKKLIMIVIMSLIILQTNDKNICAGGPPDNFTATMITGALSMPMAKMGNNMRFENPAMKGIVNISLPDEKKVLMLSDITKKYFEMPIDDNKKKISIYDKDVEIEKKKLAEETIDGHPCVKYDAAFYKKDTPSEKHNAIIWEATDLNGFVIKSEMQMPKNMQKSGVDKITTEVKDIKLGAATASMFQIPADYKKAANMMELMGINKMVGAGSSTGSTGKTNAPAATTGTGTANSSTGGTASGINKTVGGNK
ncbi:hypothetical protein MCHI_002936 [Candidatus Magnetoovum chiemensis]|nr:hypothetical protein MCHI_002936 [Candidatus Magnetoovum chiemensis]